MITGEVSAIYKKAGRVRKVHLLLLLPSLEAAQKFSQRLGRLGNVASDGRPILGLDAKYLLELVLEIDPQSLVIPAHIWTPWFSVLGSKSGFDSLEECFEDGLAHIYALETGLSSDPAMNWRVGALDRFLLVSNSDAHSPQKLGREANLFTVPPTYPDLAQALRSQRGLCRHPGILSPGRQIPPGRPPQLRPAPPARRRPKPYRASAPYAANP